MKAIKYLAIVLAGFFIFTACQKEFSIESGFAGELATGSLRTIAGECKPITPHGVFLQDSALGADNYVTVQVNIVKPGIYKIMTDVKNGFSFRDSGYIVDTGMHTFSLKATGKPVLASPTNFIVTFDTSFCTFSIDVVGRTPAVFSLAGTATNCSNASVEGTYEVGIPLAASNKVDLQVDVDSIGGYSITTASIGGMTFSGAGNFTSTGLQIVTLQGSGTPVSEGVTAFPISAGSSNCSFNVTVAAQQGGQETAVFTLGDCAKTVVKGTYKAGAALTDSNTVTLEVNVTTKGAYIINTNPVDGIMFASVDSFTATGIQQVVLKADGTPTDAGIVTVSITAGNTTCSFTINVDDGTTPAAYSASSDLCSTAMVNGSYRAGTPLNSTNTIGISLNVTSPGNYSITTGTANGISFSSAGKFATAGIQNINLTGSGTPTSAGTTNIPISIGSTSCNFAVSADTARTGGTTTNSWSFTEGTKTFSGRAGATIGDDPVTGNSLELGGPTWSVNSDTSLGLHIQMPSFATQPVAGTYKTDPNAFSTNTSSFVLAKETPTTPLHIYDCKSGTGAGAGVIMKIIITSYDASTKVVKGTFDGVSWDKTGAVVNITNGKFNAIVK